jgi:hypothetical protein
VFVCADDPLPEAVAEDDVCVDALLVPPWPAPASVEDEVEVWAPAAPEPALADPFVPVWALAEPEPALADPEVEVWAPAAPEPALAAPEVEVEAPALPAPPLPEPELAFPPGSGSVPLTMPIPVPGGQAVAAGWLVGLPALPEPPPDTDEEPEVEVLADAFPPAGWLLAELDDPVVVRDCDSGVDVPSGGRTGGAWGYLRVVVVTVWLWEPPGPAGLDAGVVHKSALKQFVVSPVVWLALTETGGATTAGWLLACVVDDVCVLEVPPLADGA